MNSPSKRLLSWLPAIVWAGTIFYFSTQTTIKHPHPWLFAHDKWVHGTIFFMLSSCVYFGFRKGEQLPPLRAALFALILSSLYGVSDEIHQIFTPTRSSDPMDWVADTVGSSLVLFFALIKRI